MTAHLLFKTVLSLLATTAQRASAARSGSEGIRHFENDSEISSIVLIFPKPKS